MPDLAMCQDHTCPSAKRCYRHEATPSERQSYADFKRGKQSVKCGHFITMGGRDEEQEA